MDAWKLGKSLGVRFQHCMMWPSEIRFFAQALPIMPNPKTDIFIVYGPFLMGIECGDGVQKTGPRQGIPISRIPAGDPGVFRPISFVLIQKPFLLSLPLPLPSGLPPPPSELPLQPSQPCLCSISTLPVPMTWRRLHPFLPHRLQPLIFQDQLL